MHARAAAIIFALALPGCAMGARSEVDELFAEHALPATCWPIPDPVAVAHFDCGEGDTRVVTCLPSAPIYADGTAWPAPARPGVVPLGGIGNKVPWCVDADVYPSDEP